MNSKSVWRLKLDRAAEHLETLNLEIRGWVQTDPIAITKEKDAEGRRHTVFAEILKAPPLSRWSLISGDCVHNLRSALDSLLYAIAVHQTGKNPPADEKVIQFPITNSPEAFESQRYRIKSLSPTVQAEIECAQPYNWPHPKHLPMLEMLTILNNLDKHRMLNVVAAVPHAAGIEMLASSGLAVTSVDVHRRALEGKTEIFSFTVEPADRTFKYPGYWTIPICTSHPPGPSKNPFSGLVGFLDSLIQEVKRIADRMEAIVGEMPTTPPKTPSHSSYFDIDITGKITLRRLQGQPKVHVAEALPDLGQSVPLPRKLKAGTPMADGIEERKERELRIEREKQENLSNWVDPEDSDTLDDSEPERVDS